MEINKKDYTSNTLKNKILIAKQLIFSLNYYKLPITKILVRL